MALNVDKRCVAYSKVKNYVLNRKKHLRFNLHPNLEREECMVRDLKLLKSQSYCTLGALQSDVWCERFDAENPVQVRLFSDEEFWEHLFSEKWSDFTSLRVCEGELLERLQEALHSLLKSRQVTTYKLARFDVLDRPVKPTLKDSSSQHGFKHSHQPVKITFTYFALDVDEPGPGSTSARSTADSSSSGALWGSAWDISSQGVTTVTAATSSGRWSEQGSGSKPDSVTARTLETNSYNLISETSSAANLSESETHPRRKSDHDHQHTKIATPKVDPKVSNHDQNRQESRMDKQTDGDNADPTIPELLNSPKTMVKDNVGIPVSNSSSSSTTTTTTKKPKRLPPESFTNSVVCFILDDNHHHHQPFDGRRDDINLSPEHKKSSAKLQPLPKSHGKKVSSKGRLMLTDPTEHVVISDDEDEDDEEEEEEEDDAEQGNKNAAAAAGIFGNPSCRSDAKSMSHYFSRKHNEHLARKQHKLVVHPIKPQIRLGLKDVWTQKNKPQQLQTTASHPRKQSIYFRFGERLDTEELLSAASRAKRGSNYYHEGLSGNDQCHSIPWIPLMNARKDSAAAAAAATDALNSKNPAVTGENTLDSSKAKDHQQQLLSDFKPLDANRLKVCHNIGNLRRYKRFEQLKKVAKISPEQRTQIHTMLETFVEDSLLLKIQEKKPARVIKLNQHCQPASSCVPRSYQVSAVYDPPDVELPYLFPVKIPTEVFRQGLLRAMRTGFVVRKEQVTRANGWTTVTSITFNRNFSCRYN